MTMMIINSDIREKCKRSKQHAIIRLIYNLIKNYSIITLVSLSKQSSI